MGGKIQISLKVRSRRNASQKISLRIKQIGFSYSNYSAENFCSDKAGFMY